MSKWVGKWKKKSLPYGWIGIVYMDGIPIKAMHESEFDLLISRLDYKQRIRNKNINCIERVRSNKKGQ